MKSNKSEACGYWFDPKYGVHESELDGKEPNHYKVHHDIVTQERPYTSPIKEQTVELIPRVLLDLKQIHLYLTDGAFHDIAKTCPDEEGQVKIHLAENTIIQNIPKDPYKWPKLIDEILLTIKEAPILYEALHTEIIKHLCNKNEILKLALKHEIEAHNQGKFLFWRSSIQGHKEDLHDPYSTKSLSDSLLAGYMQDGIFSSDIAMGITNYSASTMAYYDIYQQALKCKELGHIEDIPIEELPEHYKQYLENLNKYELYAVVLTKAEIEELAHKGLLHIPANSISSEVCFQNGEEFHPRIELSGLTEDFWESHVSIIYPPNQ